MIEKEETETTEVSNTGESLLVSIEPTVNLVSHVHEHAKLWASIAPLVEQVRR